MKKEYGITLIALVITIIILLILAGIALNGALGENGLFQKAKVASEMYNNSQKDENKNIDELNDVIDDTIDFINNRKLLAPGISIEGQSHEGYEDWFCSDVTVTITDEVAKVNSKAKKIRYEVTGAENKTDTVEIPEEGERAISFKIEAEGEIIIKAYSLDERGKEVENKKEETIRIDKTKPTIEIENGAIEGNTVEIKVKNKEDEISKIKEFKYGIKGESEEQIKYGEKTEKENYIFELTTDNEYIMKAIAIDNAGNEGESNEIVFYKELDYAESDIEINVSPENTWVKDFVTVKIVSKQPKYKLQYSKDNVKWEDYNKDLTINENGYIYARLINDKDITGKVIKKEIKNIDKNPPEKLEINVVPGKTTMQISIKTAEDAKATNKDGQSGIGGYRFSIDNGKNWTSYAETTSHKFNDIYGSLKGVVCNIIVEVKDKAGNIKQVKQQSTTTCLNTKYYKKGVGTVVCTINGRVYKKTTAEGSLLGAMYEKIDGGNWVGPLLVGNTKNSVMYECGSLMDRVWSVNYHGTTYYGSGGDGCWQNVSPSGALKVFGSSSNYISPTTAITQYLDFYYS